MLDMIPMIKKTDIVNAIEKDETKDSSRNTKSHCLRVRGAHPTKGLGPVRTWSGYFFSIDRHRLSGQKLPDQVHDRF